MQSPVCVPDNTARRLHRLVEPIHLVTYFCEEPTAALLALGLRNYWDGYFAGRAAPLGRVPAEVVHAVFYNFADGEVARHIPRVWETTTPEAALAAREQGAVAALRRILGDLADGPGLTRAADLATLAATSAPTEGRILYAALRALPLPVEPVARLWHAATLLREHRGDGHNVALVAAGIGGTEAHVLLALSENMPAEKFGRVHTSLRQSWPGLWTGCGPAVSSTPPAGSVTPAGRQRSGSSRSPTTSPRRPTPAWSRASSASSLQTSSPSPQRSTQPAPANRGRRNRCA